MQSITKGQGIEIHILDDTPTKIINNHEGHKISCEYTDWKRDDNLTKFWIRVTLSEEVLFLVSGLNIAKEMSESLEVAFSQDIKDRERSPITRPQNCKTDSSSTPEFLKK